jgi:hypothetical protein
LVFGLPVAVLLMACGEGNDTTWVQFNADEDQYLEVEVLPVGDPAGAPITLDLVSNIGRTVVGTAEIDPGSGPVGTDHVVAVDVFDDFELEVQRVTVFISAEPVSDLDGDGVDDARSETEYELLHDSADLGAWARSFESHGEPDERRTDAFTFFLWEPEILTEDE